MSKWILIFLLAPISLLAQQRSLDLTMKFKDLNGADLKNVKITLIETSTNMQVELITNENGVVSTVLDTGFRWSVNLLDAKEYAFVELPSAGVRTQKRTITYVPAKYREEAKNFDRSGVTFKEVSQKATSSTKPNSDANVLAIKVVDRSKRAVKGVKLTAVSVSLEKKFLATTNPSGWAYFLLPHGETYEIDVPGIEAYKTINIPKGGFTSIEYEILFVPTKVDETATNDTTFQELNASTKATSERVLMKVFVRNFEGEGRENEMVYWDDQETEAVFSAKTNAQGFAYFLLPKNSKYVLNLTYEREIELFNLESKTGAIASGYIEVSYRGTQVIEEFYKTTERDENGFVISFMETPVTVVQTTTEYYEKTDKGYVLNFDSDDMMYTPMVVNGKLYTSHGFYSNEFSCFDAVTGKMLWSTELSEGGASPATYYDGYVLLITESCSFYLLDAESGELTWSKWLAPYVICTPSASDGKLYVVYENDATGYSVRGKTFVMACFDIKSGDVLWQQWIDNEALATPVIADDNVYLATLSGRLYVFDKNKGDLIKDMAIDATCAPTIIDDKVFINRRVEGNTQALCIIEKGSWDLKMVAKSGKLLPGDFDRMDDMQYLIPYEGSRCLIKDGRMFYTIDNILYCRTLTGSFIWQKGIATAPDEPTFGITTMPIACGKNIMVGTSDGRLLTYDVKDGKLLETIVVGETISSQPALANNSVYVGSVGKVHMFGTNDKSHNDWPMWNGNEEHNTYVE